MECVFSHAHPLRVPYACRKFPPTLDERLSAMRTNANVCKGVKSAYYL